MDTYIYIYICIYVHVYIYIYIYTYIDSNEFTDQRQVSVRGSAATARPCFGAARKGYGD